MTVRDPVCGMCLEWEEARAFQRVGNAVVYFCCTGCAARFDEDPESYLDAVARPEGDANCPPTVARRSVLSHGIPSAVSPDRLPQVGSMGIDAFEARVRQAWCGPERSGEECRVLSRALLCRVLGWAEPHGIRVRIAAEISRLRSGCDDVAPILERLAALPYAVAAAARDAGLPTSEIDRLQSAMAREVVEAGLWLDPSAAIPSTSSPETRTE